MPDLNNNVQAAAAMPPAFPLPKATWRDYSTSQLRVVDQQGTVDGPLIFHFHEPVARGTGTVGLIDQNGAVAGIWDMSDTAVTVRGNEVAIAPGHVLAPGSYVLQMAGPVVTDMSGNPSPLRYDLSLTLATTADGGHVMRPFMGAADGAGPNDVAVLDGRIEDFTFERTGKDLLASGPQGNFLYSGVERVMFTQSDYVLLASQLGAEAQINRLYQAAFDRAPDKEGLEYWLSQRQHGMDMHGIAERFLLSPEFQSRYGPGLGDTAFVSSLYHNVLHRDGDADGMAFHLDHLTHGMARADVLLAFSESPENQAAVASLIGNGFTYTPYG